MFIAKWPAKILFPLSPSDGGGRGEGLSVGSWRAGPRPIHSRVHKQKAPPSRTFTFNLQPAAPQPTLTPCSIRLQPS